MGNEFKWLSAYIYYAEPWGEILIEVIEPLASRLLGENKIAQFHFVRYWEKSPHIRVRFYGDANVLQEELRPFLVDYFGAFFANKPSVLPPFFARRDLN